MHKCTQMHKSTQVHTNAHPHKAHALVPPLPLVHPVLAALILFLHGFQGLQCRGSHAFNLSPLLIVQRRQPLHHGHLPLLHVLKVKLAAPLGQHRRAALHVGVAGGGHREVAKRAVVPVLNDLPGCCCDVHRAALC